MRAGQWSPSRPPEELDPPSGSVEIDPRSTNGAITMGEAVGRSIRSSHLITVETNAPARTPQDPEPSSSRPRLLEMSRRGLLDLVHRMRLPHYRRSIEGESQCKRRATPGTRPGRIGSPIPAGTMTRGTGGRDRNSPEATLPDIIPRDLAAPI